MRQHVDECEPEEEGRIDPQDGKLRTLEQLRRACANRYTPAEIESYWEWSCRPHVLQPFEGFWVHDLKTHAIQGEALYWHVGIDTKIEVTSPTSFAIELDGQSHQAHLEADGQHLTWSDGDRWVRSADPWEARSSSDRDPLLEGHHGSCASGAREGHTYKPGDRVKYWSGTASKWVTAVVKGQHSDGTYELDVKRRALAEHLRPASSAGKKQAGRLEDVRWRMQLPRALSEWQLGDPTAFEKLLASRIQTVRGQDQARAIHDMLQDALAVCSSLGFSSEELEKAFRLIESSQAEAEENSANPALAG